MEKYTRDFLNFVIALKEDKRLALSWKDMAGLFLIDGKTGQLYFLEMNTIPGMTATSLVPEAIGVSGKNLGNVLKLLINERLGETRKK